MTNRCDVKFPISTGLLSRSSLTKEPWLNYSTVSPSVLQIHGRTQPAFNTGDVNDTLLKKISPMRYRHRYLYRHFLIFFLFIRHNMVEKKQIKDAVNKTKEETHEYT